MQPWQPQGLTRAQPPLDDLHQTPASPSDDDLDEPAAPPRYYFERMRQMFPHCSRRDGLKAWDLSADNGRVRRSEEERVQSALVEMESLLNPTIARDPQPSPSGSRTRLKRKADEGKGKEKALFLADDQDDDVVIAGGRNDDSRVVKRRRASGVDGANKQRATGKAKARQADLVILDDDDDDDVLIIEGRSGNTNQGKGTELHARPVTASNLVGSSSSNRLEPKAARLPSPPPSPLEQLLQLLPDLDPAHAEELLVSPEFQGNLDQIMDHLLSREGGYPKVEMQREADREKEIDYDDIKARQRTEGEKSGLYKRLALDQLYTDFATLPTTVIKSTFLSPDNAASYFAPAYLSLYTRSKAGEFDKQLLKNRRKPPKKATKWIRDSGGGSEPVQGRMVEVEERDEDLEKEMVWVKKKILAQRKEKKTKLKLEKAEQDEQDRRAKLDAKAKKAGKAHECQCCYDQFARENTVPCEKGHLFCNDCAVSNASHRIGDQQYTLPCMTDCDASFSPTCYKDWLPEKMRCALERLQAEKEVEMAFEGVEGFEKCPFCPFAMYIENKDERLFACLREDCQKVSCRACKKEGHVPLTCEEADRDARMSGVHAVEDAMAEAMIRSCPKCKLRYYKGEACNKITCSKCGALSCYICGKIVKDYTHFDQTPGNTANSSKCPLFDDTEMRHYNEVEEARKKAQTSLDSKTQDYAEKLAADKPERQAPRHAPQNVLRAPPLAGPHFPNPPLPMHPPVADAGGRMAAAERAFAAHAFQLAEIQRQRDIILEQEQNLLALQYQFPNVFHFPPQPPLHLQGLAPADPVNQEAARQARYQAAARRMNRG